VYANDGNLLGKKINTRKKNTKALLDASNKVKAEKIRNVHLVARMQDKITTKRELTRPLKIWLIEMFLNGTSNKNLIHKGNKNSLNLQETWYHLVHNLFLTFL